MVRTPRIHSLRGVGGPWLRYLVGELRSCMPPGEAKKKEKKKKKKQSAFRILDLSDTETFGEHRKGLVKIGTESEKKREKPLLLRGALILVAITQSPLSCVIKTWLSMTYCAHCQLLVPGRVKVHSLSSQRGLPVDLPLLSLSWGRGQPL